MFAKNRGYFDIISIWENIIRGKARRKGENSFWLANNKAS